MDGILDTCRYGIGSHECKITKEVGNLGMVGC